MFNGRYILIAVGIIAAFIIWRNLHLNAWAFFIFGGLAVVLWKQFTGRG